MCYTALKCKYDRTRSGSVCVCVRSQYMHAVEQQWERRGTNWTSFFFLEGGEDVCVCWEAGGGVCVKGL